MKLRIYMRTCICVLFLGHSTLFSFHYELMTYASVGLCADKLSRGVRKHLGRERSVNMVCHHESISNLQRGPEILGGILAQDHLKHLVVGKSGAEVTRSNKSSFFKAFFCLTPPLSLNSEIRGCPWLLREPLGLQGKEGVFFEMEWPGFEPRTSEPRESEEDAPTMAAYHNL